MNMRVIRAKDYHDMSRKAAGVIAAQLILHPNSVLGLATGSTPIGTYARLVEQYQQGDLDFSGVTTVNLDEYYGLDRENDQSYHYFMQNHLFRHVNIDPARIHLPQGLETDTAKECARYDALIASLGGVDLQLLGIGRNGHVGFNEPASSFTNGTHCVRLSTSTIEANQRFFPSADDVPRRAYSMGIQTIMSARTVLLAASGKDKAWAIKEVLTGGITPQVPGSILQLHPHVIVIADEDAMSMIPQT